MKVIPIALLLSLIGCIVAETEIFSIQWEPNKIEGTNQWEPVFPNDRPLPEGSVFSKPAQQMETIFVDEIGPNKTIVQEADKNHSGINVTFLDLKPDQYRKVLELLPGAQLNLVTLQWTKTKTQNPYLDVLERTTVAMPGPRKRWGGVLQHAGALRRADDKKEAAKKAAEEAEKEAAKEATERAAEAEAKLQMALKAVDYVTGKDGCGDLMRKEFKKPGPDPMTWKISRDKCKSRLNRCAEDQGKLTRLDVAELTNKLDADNDGGITVQELMKIKEKWESIQPEREGQ